MTVTPIVTQQSQPAPETRTPDRPESPFRQADAGRLFRLGRIEADIMAVSRCLTCAAGHLPRPPVCIVARRSLDSRCA